MISGRAPGSDPGERDRARELFAGFLERREADGADDLEELVAAHPASAERLRALHAAWQELEDVFGEPDAPPGGGPAVAGVVSEERYRFEGRLATGGMGEVERVHDRELGRDVARKTLLADAADDPRRLGRFLEEARITAQLEHPAIVPVHDIGIREDGRPFFTMALVRGQSLAQGFAALRRADGSWSRSRVLGVLIRVCEAVAFAHSRGVVHRDLKPENVMVGEFGEVYVADWGLAVSEGRAGGVDAALRRAVTEPGEDSALLTRDGDVLGTPAYMSPEQADAVASAVGPQSDVYAVGTMLYELLAGRPPYEADSREASHRTVLDSLRRGPPEPLAPRSGPAELLAIQARAMARDPGSRYPTAEALRDDLIAFRDSRVVRAYRTGALAELRWWVRRNRVVTAVVLCAVVGLVAALLLIDDARRRAEDGARVAERAREHARAEAASATAGFATAAESVERLLTQVGRDVLRDVPHATEIRRQLLDDALDLEERLLALRPDDPETRRRVARARNHAAHLQTQIGEREAAERSYRRCIDELRALLEGPEPTDHAMELPWQTVVWTDLLANHAALALDLATRGELRRARDVLSEVAADVEARRTLDTAAAWQRRIAEYELARAFVATKASDHRGACEAYRAGLQALLGCLQRDGSDPELELQIAHIRTQLAFSLLRAGELDDTASELLAARAVHERLLKQGSPSAELRSQAQLAARCEAAMLLKRGARRDALVPLRRSAELAWSLVADFPAVSRYYLEAALASGRLGEELHRFGADDASVVLDRSLGACRTYLELVDGSVTGHRLFHQVQMVRFRTALGAHDWQTAARLAGERLEIGGDPVQQAKGAQQFLRLAAVASRDDEAVSERQGAAWRRAALEGLVDLSERLPLERRDALREWIESADLEGLQQEPGFPRF